MRENHVSRASPQSPPPFTKRCLLIPLLPWTVAAATAAPLPLVCELTSEPSATIKIRLTERTARSLKGVLVQDTKVLGVFQTGKPRPGSDPWWSVQNQHNSSRGVSVLFRNTEAWNPYQTIPRPKDTNRVLFVGLASALWNWSTSDQQSAFRRNRELLRAAAGFWSISSSCLGGRMING
jgi:hypothetical protein